ncbi:acyl carrier protein [Streptomyces tailanensis]|uniref:acyl carrier protein n=1 Tax=Streptomyces tailanensis TaxID=2569858 RepID=UPI00155B0C73|nr:acyl carrier protein [Streptomyces tailanensis]
MPVEVSTQEVRSAVQEFLKRFIDDVEGIDDVRLITGGLLDSLVAVQMIDFIQQRFGITVEDEDLEIANFDSVNGVVAFVDRKAGTA